MTSAARVPGYGLELPSVDMIVQSLSRYLDDDEVESVWSKACATCGVDPDNAPTTADEWLELVTALEGCGDLAAVCAKGLRIRIMSWAVLSRGARATTAQVGI